MPDDPATSPIPPLRKVRAGDPLAEFTLPPTADAAGVTATPGKRGCTTRRDGALVAKLDGSARIRAGVLDVVPLLEIDGSVDVSTDPAQRALTFDGDVLVTGPLRAGRKLDLTGCAWITDAVESVELRAGIDLAVAGGIVGGDTGTCSAGGAVSCRFVSGGTLAAGGHVSVDGEVAHCALSSSDALAVTRGPVYGGTVSANGGIRCPVIGKPAGTRTVIEAGVDQLLRTAALDLIPKIEARRKHVREVRAKLEPLLRYERALSAKQRERATELLWEAGEVGKEADADAAALAQRDRESQARSSPSVYVDRVIYPGVTIRFPGVEADVRTELPGPLVIRPGKSDSGTPVVVATNLSTGEEHFLDSRPTTDPAEQLLTRVIRTRPVETGIRAKCIRAFVDATEDLFKTMIKVPLTLTKPRLKERDERVHKLYRIATAVSVSGAVEGTVWINFSEKVAVAIASSLGGETFPSSDDPNCRDALGEVGNMIVGSAKRNVADRPLSVSVPAIHLTEAIDYPSNVPIILIPFDTPFGRFIIEFALSEEQQQPQSQAAA